MIYVIEGATGEYSDRYSWLVCAFETEEKAIGFINEANDICENFEKWLAKTGKQYYKERDELSKRMQHLDKNTSMDYTGTYYDYYEVEIR